MALMAPMAVPAGPVVLVALVALVAGRVSCCSGVSRRLLVMVVSVGRAVTRAGVVMVVMVPMVMPALPRVVTEGMAVPGGLRSVLAVLAVLAAARELSVGLAVASVRRVRLVMAVPVGMDMTRSRIRARRWGLPAVPAVRAVTAVPGSLMHLG